MRESFVFYASFYEAINNLPDETQLELYTAICKYSLYDELPQLSPVAKAMFTLIKPNIDNATARYKASVENGKRGGRPQKEKPTETQAKPNNNPAKPSNNLNVDVYVDDNVNVDVNENDIKADKPQRSRFAPPSLAEVKSYCKGRGSTIDAQQFYDYFTAANWTDSKGNKVRNWKQKVITWESYEKGKQTRSQSKEEMKSYDLDKFFELAAKKGGTK